MAIHLKIFLMNKACKNFKFQFFADGLTGFAIALTGAIRNIQIVLGSQNYTVTRLFCVFMPYNIILAWLVKFS